MLLHPPHLARRRPSHPTFSVPTTVHALTIILREAPVRVMVHRAGGPALLAPFVAMPSNGSPLNIQLLYEAALCVWQLSFYKPAAEALSGAGAARAGGWEGNCAGLWDRVLFRSGCGSLDA
jgi:hypothetical protein